MQDEKTQDKEKSRAAGNYLWQACRECFFEFLPKCLPALFGMAVVVIGPILVSRFCGDGWGLFAAIISIGVWLCAVKLWFFPTIRLIWFIILAWLVIFAIFEVTRLQH